MSDTGWGIVLVLGLISAIALVLSVATWQFFRTQQARAASKVALTHDGAYRSLAEETSMALRKNADEQVRISQELTELRTRLSTVEKILKDVD